MLFSKPASPKSAFDKYAYNAFRSSRNNKSLVIGVAVVFIFINLFFLFSASPSSSSSSTDASASSQLQANYPVRPVTPLEADYNPKHAVAWAIPVGGRTKRAPQLRMMLNLLRDAGVPRDNIFVFEDEQSRPDRLPDADVAAVTRDLGIRVLQSHIPKDPENSSNFGIHLARHYHFMLDTIFLGHGHQNKKDVYPDLSIERTFEFAVVLEDDLQLAPDIVKYFWETSRVMRVDDSLYCVGAHQDNAYPATSRDPSSSMMISSDFDFRRGEHFMAPGWMTSAKIYKETVRPVWLDDQGEYFMKSVIGLKNGHWDRFFDSQIKHRECIFAEVPRIIHKGADGFTVGKQGQMELYDNLVLSKVKPDIDYGDMARLTANGYENEMMRFLANSTTIASLDEIPLYRYSKLKFVVDANDDRDRVWNQVIPGYFGIIGLGGYGGNPKYAKLRGVHKGSVMIRYLTNLVLLVGSYSPYVDFIVDRPLPAPVQNLPIKHHGCFEDRVDRDLPHLLINAGPENNLSPGQCVKACSERGFKFAGLQMGQECWCGSNYGRHGRVEDNRCRMRCGGGESCGGPFVNSVYSSLAPSPSSASAVSPRSAAVALKSQVMNQITEVPLANGDRLLASSPNAVFVRGGVGETCYAACLRASEAWTTYAQRTDFMQQAKAVAKKANVELPSSPTRYGKSFLTCDAELMPLLHTNCEALSQLMGCDSCVAARNAEEGFAAPGLKVGNKQCLMSSTKYLQCGSPPPANFQRACVCRAHVE